MYLFLDKKGIVLYVGKAKNLRNRVASYFTNRSHLGEKTRLLLSQATHIQTILAESEFESLLLEANLIKKHSPFFNVRMTDGKAYPLIRITTNHMYPSVLIARRPDDSNSVYFGPFPHSGAVRSVLKTLRRIFPFQSVQNHPKRLCLYNHLGLCPCPPMLTTDDEKKVYRKTIQHMLQFLEGKKKAVMKDLEKERNQAVKQEDFEKAQKIQKQIDAIAYVTSPIHRPFEYEINPNLQEDLRKKEQQELIQHLARFGINVAKLDRIECYDISNISGTHAVGSMVVFIDGEKDSSSYRRFRIRRTQGPNDVAMMQEVLRRRLNHDEWPLPDLFIIDGGKGQVSSAGEVITNEYNLTIPIVGLAKREERMITFDFQEIVLPHNSNALQLMIRIRNEAHRFAIMYHRKLRSKALL